MWTMCQSIFLIPTSLDPPLSSPLDPQHFTRNVTGGTAQGNKSNFTIFCRCITLPVCAGIQYRSSLCWCTCAWSQPVHMHAYYCSIRIFTDVTNIVFPNASVDHWRELSITASAYYGSKNIPNIDFPAWNRELDLFPVHISWIEWADPKHGVCNSLCTLYLFTDLVILPLGWLCHLGQLRPDATVLWCDINDTFPCYKADLDLASITQCIGYLSCLISYAGMSWQIGNKLKYQEVQEHDPNTLDYLTYCHSIDRYIHRWIDR